MSYADVILADNPDYYLPLDVLPVTNSGSGTRAVATGATLTLDGPGIGDALASVQFDGASAGNQEFVRIDRALTGTRNSVSVELWLKGTVKNTNPRVVYFYNSASWLNLQMDDQGRPSVVYGGYPSTYVTASSTKDVQDGEWHHLAVVANVGTKTLDLYVDGELADTKSGYSLPSNTLAPLWIGQSGASGALADGNIARIYDGVVSQFALWTSTALTAERVKAHYDAGMGIGPVPVEPLDLSSGEAAESAWTALAAQVSLAEPAPATVALSTGQVAEAVWKATGARLELVTPIPAALIVQSGTAAQATFRGVGGRIVLTEPAAEQLTLLAGEQAEAVWQALAAQADLTEPIFIPVGEWQLAALMPKGELMASMRTHSAEATLVRSQSNTRMNSNNIEAVMASKVLLPELKEEV